MLRSLWPAEDDTGVEIAGDVRSRPSAEDLEPTQRQIRQVNGRPRRPGRKSAQLHFPGFEDGEVSSNDRHVALVEVAERRPRRSAGHAVRDEFPDILPLLHRDLRDAGQRPPFLFEMSGVADHEHLRPPGNAQIGTDGHPSGSIALRLEPLGCRRGPYTGGPKYGSAQDPLTAHDHALVIDLVDMCARPDFDA